MKQEHRVEKLEEIIEVRHTLRNITAAVNEDGTPHGESNAKLIQEGKDAEARGELIEWELVTVLYDK